MKNIHFIELTIINFLSYGNNVTKINLDFNDPKLIIGKNFDSVVEGQVDSNGAGKSSILNALLECLYDKNLMNITKSAKINKTNGKDMYLSVVFCVGDDYYKIERYRANKTMGGDGVRILRGNTLHSIEHDITPDSISNANNLITDIIGIPYEMFIRIIVFSASHVPFLQLPPSGKGSQKEIIEELFGLTVLPIKSEKLKNLLSEEKKEFERLELLNNHIVTTNTRLVSQIEEMKQKYDNWAINHHDKLAKLEKTILVSQTIDLMKYEKILHELKELDSNIIIINNKKDSYSGLIKQLQHTKKMCSDWEYDKELKSNQLNIKKIELNNIDFDYFDSVIANKKELLNVKNDLTNLHKIQIERKETGSNKIEEVKKIIRNNASNVFKLKDEILKLENNECPYCKQHFNNTGNKIDSINFQINELEKNTEDQNILLSKYNSAMDKLCDNIISLETSISDNINKLSEINSVIIPHNFEILKMDKLKIQSMIDTHDNTINPYIKDVEILQTNISDNTDDLTTLDDMLQSLVIKRDRIRQELIPECDTEIKINLLRAKQDNDLHLLSQLIKEVNPYLELLSNLCNTTREDELTEQINELDHRIKHIDYLYKLFTKKDSFIRKELLSKNIPLLNKRLKVYLDSIGLPHKVTFNETMGVDISQFGEEFEYGNFSAGQKARVNISLAFAFRDVLQDRYAKTNLCILDECLDVGLGTVGVLQATKMIKNVAKQNDLAMLVISHKDELFNMFDDKLEIHLKNGFSNIV